MSGTTTARDLFDLHGRVAIVTGASSGLGEGFARTLARAGATVVAAARRLDRLTVLAKDVGSDEGSVVPVACDVSSADDRRRLVDTAARLTGHIDVLVNNAGIPGRRTPSRRPPRASPRCWTSTSRPASTSPRRSLPHLVQVNIDGTISVLGRQKQIIIRGGRNIDINEVEAAVARIPSVAQVCVVPVPDEMLGERAAALVVATDPGLTLEDVTGFLAEGFPKSKWPEFVFVVPDLPQNRVAKLSRIDATSLATRLVRQMT